MKYELVVNPIKCDGRGTCAELFPESVALDDWGFPMLKQGSFDGGQLSLATHACGHSPTKALTIRAVK
jgi:ferredoxin